MKPVPDAMRVHVLYPNRYAWFILTSTLDILLTHSILHHFADFGGREINTIADWVIRKFDMWGAIGLKFLTVVIVITICEIVGRKRPVTGNRLATAVVILSLIPLIVALKELAKFALSYP